MIAKEYSIEAPRVAAQTISVSTSNATSTFTLNGTPIYYCCDQDSFILFGSSPTATTSCTYIPAKTPFRIANIKAGDKIAVIAAASGTAYISEAI